MSGVYHRLCLNKTTKVVSIIIKGGIDMAKGYIVADVHVRDKEGFEKFREMAKAVREKACATDLFLAEGI